MAKRQTKPKLDDQQIQEEIRRRAYELYKEKGEKEGTEHDNWLQAEKEIKKKYKVK
ncbi:MAG: DUF2934 domain-containing protein [Calditrichia bacterium]